MGIRYSLCVLMQRNESDSLLAEFLSLLDVEGQTRIRDLKWSPESEVRRMTLIGTSEIDARGIAGINLDEYESPNSYCFSLHVQLEPEMESLLGEHGLRCFKQPGPFGCMWTSLFAGETHLLLQMTASTSGMSRVIQESEAIHAVWINFARKINATFAYIDVEDDVAIQLFPHYSRYGDLHLPDSSTLAYDGDCHFSVDRMASFVFRSFQDER